jgi:DNA-binding response OmpR family regulator
MGPCGKKDARYFVQDFRIVVEVGVFRTVLITDDDHDLREEMAWGLRVEGYRVLVAGTAIDTLTTLSNNDVDLLVLDLRMPSIGGRAVLDAVSGDSRYAKLAVLIVTGAPELAPPELAVLTKPFSNHQFVTTVRTVVGPARRRALTTPIPGATPVQSILDGNGDDPPHESD